jgi:hypothetical protein
MATMTETPASGPEDDELTPVMVAGKYPIYLRRPTEGQMTALIMLGGIDAEDDFTSIAGHLIGLSEVMDSLCIDPADTGDEEATTVRHLYRLMCRGEIDLEDYLGPAVALAERWGDREQIEKNRADRRAAKSAPAKKAVARTGRPVRR